jgi:hypothetical protein
LLGADCEVSPRDALSLSGAGMAYNADLYDAASVGDVDKMKELMRLHICDTEGKHDYINVANQAVAPPKQRTTNIFLSKVHNP